MDSKKVENIFDSISANYDRANAFISLGIEKYWRKRFNSFINGSEKNILDACCGTGVSTLDIWKQNGYRADICGADFSAEMLEVAEKRVDKIFKSKNLKNTYTCLAETGSYAFKETDITTTAFKDNSFDLITMLFGIRNITDRKKALLELYRITSPGGRLMIMEFCFPRKGLFSKLYGFYLNRIMVNIGAILTKNRGAYRHLAESIKNFPQPADFVSTIKSCGWKNVKYLNMTMGTCIIYIAFK